MFNNNSNFRNNNGGNNNINCSTKIRTFFGELSAFQLSFWNENLSVKINPIKGVNSEGIREYDFDSKAITAFGSDKATALAKNITETILPLVEKVYNGELKSIENPVTISSEIGGNKGNVVVFRYKNDNNGTPAVYFAIQSKFTTPEGQEQTYEYAYKFEKTPVQVTEGEETVTKMVESEFLFMLNFMKNLYKMAGISHEDRLTAAVQATFNNRNNNYNNNYNNQGGQTMGNQSYSTQGAPAAESTYSAPVTTFDPNSLPF